MFPVNVAVFSGRIFLCDLDQSVPTKKPIAICKLFAEKINYFFTIVKLSITIAILSPYVFSCDTASSYMAALYFKFLAIQLFYEILFVAFTCAYVIFMIIVIKVILWSSHDSFSFHFLKIVFISIVNFRADYGCCWGTLR